VGVPAGYDPAAADTDYPVLETFSGYPSSPTQWVKTMRLQAVLAEQVTAHRIRPTVVVSPQVEVPAGVDTECVNGEPSSPQLETWLTQDVPNWLVAHFRVRTERSSWATIGLSAGGWCAAMAAMLHPAQYGAGVVMGGYFRPLFGPSYEPYQPGSALAKRYDLVALAKRSPEPLALWVETSHADPVSYTSSTALLKAAKSPLSVSATILQNAGHRIGIWQNLLPGALSWLGQNVPGFRP
jgi:S-formylglutathione hydrolase FrmB